MTKSVTAMTIEVSLLLVKHYILTINEIGGNLMKMAKFKVKDV
jgi:hypothetical protein